MANFIEVKTSTGNVDSSELSSLSQAEQKDLLASFKQPGVHEYQAGAEPGNEYTHHAPKIHDPLKERKIDPNSVLDTARTAHGSPVLNRVDIKPDTVVTVNGITMEAESAAKAGLLVKNADGTYSDLGVAPEQQRMANTDPQQKTKEEQAPAPKQVDLSSMNIRTAINQIKDDIGSDAGDQLIMRLVGHAGMGEDSEGSGLSAVKDLATTLGTDIETAKKAAENIANNLLTNAAAYAKHKLGIQNAEEIIRWAQDECKPDVRSSLMQRLFLNDLTVIGEIQERFKLKIKG